MTVAELIETTLTDRGVEWERTGDHSYAVVLPGTHKLKTVCNLIVGEHALRIEAFLMRRPDERREELWAWLLQRNARMYAVAFAIDKVGDVYLTGRVPVHAVTPTSSTGSSARSSNTPTRASTPCCRSASARPSGGNGPGGSSEVNPWTTCAPSSIWSTRPDRPLWTVIRSVRDATEQTA